MRLERAILTRNLLRYYHAPFDQRYLYWVPEVDSPEARQYRRHIHEANGWLAIRRTPLRDWSPPYFSTALGSSWVMGGPTAFFPMHLRPEPGISALRKSSSDQPGSLNLSQRALAVAGELGAVGPVPFYHTLAILHSPRYRQEHADALLLDWPRVPVSAEREAFVCSAELGYRVAAELSMEWEWETYAEGPSPGVLRVLARLTREDGGVPDPDAGELDLTAGWGPVERSYTEEERSALGAAVTLLGDSTFDVHLNRRAYWKNVPSRVWRYTLGGYQVIKEWLSARDRDLLCRSLTAEEVRYAEEMTRRIAGILLMEPALDANYEAVRRNAYSWPEAGSAPG
jgi:Type ISP C-terminal specificity domain